MVMSLFATKAFAQLHEVRGVETRRVIYESDNQYQSDNGGYSGRRYGWEISNRNPFAISVDVSLNSREKSVLYNNQPAGKMGGGVVKTQSIVLKSGESYVFKREDHCSTKVDAKCPVVDDYGYRYSISDYYIEYKAYKLQ